jgi:hypothetical protein
MANISSIDFFFMKIRQPVHFWILITKKILKNFFRVGKSKKSGKNSRGLDHCFPGMLYAILVGIISIKPIVLVFIFNLVLFICTAVVVIFITVEINETVFFFFFKTY